MKKIVLASLMMVCLPYWAMSQSVDDDLYFIPKKKAEKKEEVKQEVKVVVPQKQNTTTVYAAPGSTVVVKDVKGKVRDVDEYNRRYTSRDNNFSMENDTLYIEEKPLNERGEWVNGFEGSQDDYEYAMRIVRFRNPRYAIPVSSPLYWDVVYGLPSWDWNVYDDGLYAYVFPTYTNRLWWDWRWNYPYGASWGFSWGWSSPWYYNSWYYPGYWEAIGATIITTTIIIIRIIPVTVGAAATGEAVMDGMAQADVIREYMPEDTPTAMALHAQAGIIM